MLDASHSCCCRSAIAALTLASSRAAKAPASTAYVAWTAASASGKFMSAPLGNGCVGTPILPREVAGTSSLPARRRASPFSNASSSLRLTSHSSASQSSTTTARTEK